MCSDCDDIDRTVRLLTALTAYALLHTADPVFVEITGSALALSLPLESFGPAPETPDDTDRWW